MKKMLAIFALMILIFAMFNMISLATTSSSAEKTEQQSSEDPSKSAASDDEHSSAAASEKEGHASESPWRFPGWQSVFTILAVIYYIGISLTALPKIASREWSDDI